MKPLILPLRRLLTGCAPLLLCLAAWDAHAAGRSCAAELGPRGAAVLVQQCLKVSPATRPPCNAANSCQMIESEILRGCALVGSDAAPFCDAPARPGVVTGTLVGGGGTDDLQLVVRRDDGSRVSLYCKADGCDDWFEMTDEGESQQLKRAWTGKRVSITVRVRRNDGVIAGPGDDELVPLAVKVTFLK
ncbi:hypothetical protein [Pseudoduganella buxea]|uniref:Secreted protein n=1 Tax=Pseudoduganella buxea TaxID=1949069 RepID=A0A6I3ST86_9BURK|nr:hypothetical protein [Pseudoduganella buxea]MTV52331.1 hypothetical protein [Pseudoduganella buxea]GGC06792.1 hypothetical protein GCM10011572_30600 [Pseudoduganella buxea]